MTKKKSKTRMSRGDAERERFARDFDRRMEDPEFANIAAEIDALTHADIDRVLAALDGPGPVHDSPKEKTP